MADSTPTPALVVIQPFGDYQRGDQITDPVVVAQILSSENASFCNKVG